MDDLENCDSEWFFSHPLGETYSEDNHSPDKINFLIRMASCKDGLPEIKCNCPEWYKDALAIAIAMLIPNSLSPTGDVGVQDEEDLRCKAFVKKDTVGSWSREYSLKELKTPDTEDSGSKTLGGILSDIIDKCRSKSIGFAPLVGSVNDQCGPCGDAERWKSRHPKETDSRKHYHAP